MKRYFAFVILAAATLATFAVGQSKDQNNLYKPVEVKEGINSQVHKQPEEPKPAVLAQPTVPQAPVVPAYQPQPVEQPEPTHKPAKAAQEPAQEVEAEPAPEPTPTHNNTVNHGGTNVHTNDQMGI